MAAWLLDETELAVRLLREALSRLRAPGVRGSSAAALSALQWACIDSGRWDEALATAREGADIAAAYKMETVAAIADLTTATVLVMRGQHDQVGPLMASALAAVGADEYRSVAARARHAAGIAALAEGNYLTAYAQLSQLFGADGMPLHQHVPYLAIADLAAAAVRAERRLEARTLIENALTRAGPAPGPRTARRTSRRRGPLHQGPVGPRRRKLAIRASPAAARLRGMAAAAAADQPRQARPRQRPGDAPPPWCCALDPARGS